MPKFLGFHELGRPTSAEEGMQIFTNYHKHAAGLGLTALGVYSNFEGGRNFCITEAETAEQVWEAHEEGPARDSLKEVLLVEQITPEDLK